MGYLLGSFLTHLSPHSVTNSHMRKLRAAYAAIDFSGMGTVSYSEFFEFIDEPRSPFTDLVYDSIVGV